MRPCSRWSGWEWCGCGCGRRRTSRLRRATAETGELPPDPRLTYTGPFRNVRPDAGYVGDARCAVCHVDIAAAYAQHPMGCSMVTARDLAGRQRYDAAVNNLFDAAGRRLRVEREGDRLFTRSRWSARASRWSPPGTRSATPSVRVRAATRT
ncbi:MAG: hypothetical protein U0736_00730 [Gemmataceae bacterium]